MKKGTILIVTVLLSVLSCSKGPKTGDLHVQVTLNGVLIKDAEVYTKPFSSVGTTDELGSVLLTGLEIGNYEVFASLDNIGTGKSEVGIMAFELSELFVNIIPGVYDEPGPIIEILSPSQPAEFSEGEEITFSANVEDDETAQQDIKIKWESDLDGVLNMNPPNMNGLTTFSTNSLSKGFHQITITAVDLDGFNSSASIQLSTLAPKSIILLEPVKNNGTVSLEWTEYPDTDFLRYEIFRINGNCTEQNEELLATISNKSTTNFIDELPPFEFQVCYFIKVINIENYSRSSNQESVDSPNGHIFNFEADDMLKHPTENYIYIIDQEGRKMIKFDITTFEVVNEINLQGTIGYCDIGDNGFGVEVYTPSDDGKIYVYNADDLSQTTSINTDLPTASVVINGLGHVIASVQPSPWWEQPVRTYLRSNGMQIDGNGDHDRDRLRMIPDKNEIISISTGVSPVDMEYFDLSNSGFIATHQDDQYHGDYPLNAKIFRISDDGTYSITSKDGAVYLANSSMEYRGELEHGTLDFSDFAFSSDGSIIYAATSNRKSIQIGSYPSLTRNDEILTKGYPVFIIRNGNKIISLSKSTENSSNMGVEVIEL